MNKSGIELSINFTVMFILAMAMFSAGIIIARQVFQEANATKEHLSDAQKDQLQRLLMDGDKVQTVFVTKEIKQGADDVFGLGIRNDFDTAKDFYIQTNLDAAFKPDKSPICNEGPYTPDDCNIIGDDLLYLGSGNIGGPYIIEPEDREVKEIFALIKKSTEKGTYIFNIRVCYYEEGDTPADFNRPCKQDLSNQYDVTKKFTVIVT